MASNDSHLSQPGSGKPDEADLVRQHHRLALGEKGVTGQVKPNGNENAGGLKIGNNQGKTY